MHIKEPLLLIGKSSLCGGSRFPLSLSEWSFTICLMPYNHTYNVLSASLNKIFLSILVCLNVTDYFRNSVAGVVDGWSLDKYKMTLTTLKIWSQRGWAPRGNITDYTCLELQSISRQKDKIADKNQKFRFCFANIWSCLKSSFQKHRI